MQRKVWTIREVARAAGRSSGNATRWANLGLLPGYVGLSDGRKATGPTGAKVPAELAEAYASLLRFKVCSVELAELMRTSPAEVLQVAEALATLARAGLELETKERAA